MGATGVNKKAVRHAYLQAPLRWRNPSGGEQALRREEFRRPAFRGQEKSVGRKTEARLARSRRLEFGGEMKRVAFGNLPWLRKCYDGIARRQRRILLGECGAIPRDLLGCNVKAPTAGEAQLDGGKRSNSRVAQLVFGVYVNPWIWPRRKLDTDFLVLDGIARPERDSARGDPKTNRGNKETKKRAGIRAWQQSDSIVAGEIGRSKKDECGSNAAKYGLT